jgi:hypothetical protein
MTGNLTNAVLALMEMTSKRRQRMATNAERMRGSLRLL